MTKPNPSLPGDQADAEAGSAEQTLKRSAEAPTDPGQMARLAASEFPPAPALTPGPSGRRPGRLGWILGGVAILAGLGVAGYLYLPRGASPVARDAAEAAPGAVPSGIQVYLDQAKAGDAHAMRMLGVMYYYGLNVPQDRAKGLAWYRKAADKGSDAAREELANLQKQGS